jgi:hypothetical protein
MTKPSQMGTWLTALAAISLAGCNPLSLLPSSRGFQVKDGEAVYISVGGAPGSPPIVRKVPADPKTFQAIPPLDNATKDSLAYACDSKQVFMAALTRPYLLQGCDPTSFTVMSDDGKYSRDARHVYYCGILLADADPDTFQILAPPYSKDANHAYAGAVAFEVLDASTFEVIRPGDSEFPLINSSGELKQREFIKPRTSIWGWARDSQACYYANKRIPNADRDTFEVLNFCYAKDKDKVYYAGSRSVSVVAGADLASFVADPSIEIQASDKNGDFLKGKRVPNAAKP